MWKTKILLCNHNLMKNWKFIKLNQKEQFKQAICVTLSRPGIF